LQVYALLLMLMLMLLLMLMLGVWNLKQAPQSGIPCAWSVQKLRRLNLLALRVCLRYSRYGACLEPHCLVPSGAPSMLRFLVH